MKQSVCTYYGYRKHNYISRHRVVARKVLEMVTYDSGESLKRRLAAYDDYRYQLIAVRGLRSTKL